MQTSRDGAAESADTEAIALTVTPARPAGPSVVTTATVAAARLIPSRNLSRSIWPPRAGRPAAPIDDEAGLHDDTVAKIDPGSAWYAALAGSREIHFDLDVDPVAQLEGSE